MGNWELSKGSAYRRGFILIRDLISVTLPSWSSAGESHFCYQMWPGSNCCAELPSRHCRYSKTELSTVFPFFPYSNQYCLYLEEANFSENEKLGLYDYLSSTWYYVVLKVFLYSSGTSHFHRGLENKAHPHLSCLIKLDMQLQNLEREHLNKNVSK